MGFLDELFGNKDAQQGSGGGMSPITLGLLALLAYRTFQGKGRLGEMLGHGQGGSASAPQGGSVPTPQGGGAVPDASGGGLGDILGGLFGGKAGSSQPGAQPGGGLGDLLRGGLGGMLGGAGAGTVLNGGLGSLLEQLQKAGHGDTADSWVGKGQNRQIEPRALEDAIGKDTLETLSKQSGKPYNDVLSELSQSLPDTVDKLTPQGRVATKDETDRWA